MKKYGYILTSALLSLGATASAQVSADPARFSPQASGYLERARTMCASGNFAGTIDQLRHLDTQQVALSEAESEEYTYLLARAYYERGDEECLQLLLEFRDRYPASPLALDASLAIGDFYFFAHKWAAAYEAYSAIDPARLNRDERLQYDYRLALSMIKTGYYKEARKPLASLRGNARYADAYNFYVAYLDYIDGDFKRAYEGFSRVAPGEQGLEAGYYMTQIEYSRGEYKTVIEHGSGLLRHDSVEELRPEIDRIVGLSYFKLGDYASARGFLENYAAKAGESISADAAYALGVADYEDGYYTGAADRFSTLTDLNDPIGQSAWLYLGQCYLKEGNASGAALAFEKSAKMNCDSAVSEKALYNYVAALTRGGKTPFSSSASMLEEFAKRYPDSEYTPLVEKYLATAYYNDHDYANALRCVNSIRRPDANTLQVKQKVLYELGVEALTNGEAENAMRYLSEGSSIKAGDAALSATVSLWLGDACYALGRYKEARKAYSDAVNGRLGKENRAIALYDLGYAEYKLEDYASAAKSFAKALAAVPALDSRQHDDALLRRADCLYYTGGYSEAASLYGKAIEGGATDTDYALYRRAVMRGLSGDTKGKIADLNLLQKDYPSSRWLAKGLAELAAVYEEEGNASLAADAYKKRLGVAENVDLDELLRMARAMEKAGRHADLLEVVEKIRHAGGLEADEATEISMFEADALAALGRNDEALSIYRSLAVNPASLAGAKSAVLVAESLLKNKEYEEARVLMEEFTDTGTPHQYWLARGFIALADAYHGLDKTYLAKEYLTSLRDNYPGDEKDIASMISKRLKSWK